MSTSLNDKPTHNEYTDNYPSVNTDPPTQNTSINADICCSLHKEKPIEYFCQSCKSPVCSTCIFQTHNGHLLVMLSDELSRYHNIIQSLQQSINDLTSKTNFKLNIIEEHIDSLKLQKQTQIKMVSKLFNEIISKIEHKRDLVISGFDQKYELTIDKIDCIKKAVQHQQNEFGVILNAVDGLLKSFEELSQEILIKKLDYIVSFITKSSNDLEIFIKKQNAYMKKFEKISKLSVIPVNAKGLMELLDKIEPKDICYPEYDNKEREAIEIKIKNNLLIRDVEKHLSENRPQKIIFESPQSRTKMSHALPLCPKLNGSVLQKYKTSKIIKENNVRKSNSNSKVSTNGNTTCSYNSVIQNKILNTEQSPQRTRSKLKLKSHEKNCNGKICNNKVVSAISTSIQSNKHVLGLPNVNDDKVNSMHKRTASESSYRTVKKFDNIEQKIKSVDCKQNNNNDKEYSSVNGSYNNYNESKSSSFQGNNSSDNYSSNNNSSMDQSFNLLDHDKQGKNQNCLYLQYRPNHNESPTRQLPLIHKK